MPLNLVRATISESAVGVETDEFLLGRIRLGDAQAGERLVLRYHQPLVRYLHRVTGQMHTAEELFQQTWLSVLEHIDKFDPSSGSGGFKAWLFRIATNKANDLWRSKARERAAHEGLRLVIDGEVPYAGHQLELSDDERRLREAISRLPEAQRQVLMLSLIHI